MRTLKIAYSTDDGGAETIREYRRQYSCVRRFVFGRREEGMSERDAEKAAALMNGVPLVRSYLRRCAVKDASQTLAAAQADGRKVIFGGRAKCVARAQGKISAEEWREARLGRLLIVGEANQRGNRMVRIDEGAGSFTFRPERGTSVTLTVAGGYRRYRKILAGLRMLQEGKAAPLTYTIGAEFICVTYDDSLLDGGDATRTPIRNRVFAVDLNPDYVGWSVTDWRGSADFRVVDAGVISIKEINDREHALKGRSLPPSSRERAYLSDKRTHETLQVAKRLSVLAAHYRCALFSMEALDVRSKDHGKGRRYNRLVNGMWNRARVADALRRRCRVLGIRVAEVNPAYSSFVGNFILRGLNMPDMVLSSVEIGRRAYEWHGQHVTKELKKRKNTAIPDMSDFGDRYAESLEEFGMAGGAPTPVEAYEYLKETKRRYRLPLDAAHGVSGSSRCFARRSMVTKYFVTCRNVSH